MRETILKTLYNWFPFDLRADAHVPPASKGIRISCIINFYGRLDLLSGIMHSLAQQRFDRDRFEVIMVEDQNGTEGGRRMADEFGKNMQTVYLPLERNFGKMGYSRNHGLMHSSGEIVLFLDDDTVLQQDDFLAVLDREFNDNPGMDAAVPHGQASFALIDGRYDYHDPYFMTSRCMAYRRETLMELGGFMENFIGQEDVEFVMRFLMAGKSSRNIPALKYFHPPLLSPSLSKPRAVGHSFYRLVSRYPFVLWLLVIINCSRHAPLYLLPVKRYHEMGRFAVGFLVGVISSLFKSNGFQYY